MDDPDYSLPMYYEVDLPTEEGTRVRIHHSRVLRFIGRELPYMETINENYWGASELEHIWEELQKRSATSANIAQLVFRANITSLKMSNFGEDLALGNESQRQKIFRTIEEENLFIYLSLNPVIDKKQPVKVCGVVQFAIPHSFHADYCVIRLQLRPLPLIYSYTLFL